MPHDTATYQSDHKIAENSKLSDVSPKHRVWDERKRSSDVTSLLYTGSDDLRMKRHGENIRQCSDVINLAVINAEFFASSWKCRERHCPICQHARARKFGQRVETFLPKLMIEHPDIRFLFLTLTVRNCAVSELRETIKHMNASRYRLFRRLSVVTGWLSSTEVTRGSTGDAHPHFHMLLVVSPSYFSHNYITQSEWVEKWRIAAKLNYDPVVDIRRIKNVADGTREIVKSATYSVKPEHISSDANWFLEMHEQVRGLRFIAAGGVLKTLLAASDELSDDLADTHAQIEQHVDAVVLFDWRRSERVYRKSIRQPTPVDCAQDAHSA